MAKEAQNMGEIVIYAGANGKSQLEVKLDQETVWLNQHQIADLFGKTIPTINEHIKHIYQEDELEKVSTIRKFRIVQSEGKRKVERAVEFYNLDVIISVGYRVKSKQGTQFRIWATKVLKDHLVKGITINQKRLQDGNNLKLKELEKAVKFLQEAIQDKQLSLPEANGLLEVVLEYTNTWLILRRYDEDELELKKSKKKVVVIAYEEALEAIAILKTDLMKKKETSELFGVEREKSLKRVVETIHQTFDGNDLYPSLEEKAAHLLYFVIKDHPFVDGNKRIGAFFFILFLKKNRHLLKKNGEKKINDNTLVALALLVAQSKPQEKEVMVLLISNLLFEK